MAALRFRRIKPRSDSGYTLVEVMVAMLLTSVMVTSVFSVALTVKTGGSKGERKIKASSGAKQIAAVLKNYVTGDPLTLTIPGPGTGPNSWSMDGNVGNGVGLIDDTSCTDCYALTTGAHPLRNILPAEFEASPYFAQLTYTVTVTDTVNGRPVPSVTITTTWTEP